MCEIRMNQPEFESFPAEVALRLKTYVYRLIDPRNGETFYVGKGQGDGGWQVFGLEQKLEGDELDNDVSARAKTAPSFTQGGSMSQHTSEVIRKPQTDTRRLDDILSEYGCKSLARDWQPST